MDGALFMFCELGLHVSNLMAVIAEHTEPCIMYERVHAHAMTPMHVQ